MNPQCLSCEASRWMGMEEFLCSALPRVKFSLLSLWLVSFNYHQWGNQRIDHGAVFGGRGDPVHGVVGGKLPTTVAHELELHPLLCVLLNWSGCFCHHRRSVSGTERRIALEECSWCFNLPTLSCSPSGWSFGGIQRGRGGHEAGWQSISHESVLAQHQVAAPDKNGGNQVFICLPFPLQLMHLWWPIDGLRGIH